MLESLAAAHHVQLPADRKRGWQNRPTPALPLRLRFPQPSVPKLDRFDHKRFPWAPEMAFIADFPILHIVEDAMHLHEFFKNGGGQSPIVPTKERSWQIFHNEKRLDELQYGQLFENGRLTLDRLRCRNVTQILAFSQSPVRLTAPVLIVENESTFHTFCRLNHQVPIYGGIVFGDGNTVLRASDFLYGVAKAIKITEFKYFGDLDLRGLRIPQSLSKIMRKFNIAVSLEELLYLELLKAVPRSILPPQSLDEQLVKWLPIDLQDNVCNRIGKCGRIAQEALGWEKLCALYGADVHSDFILGFSQQA
jgi:hypothetical protein